VAINLDGAGKAEVSTGIGFLDHMLEQLAKHGSLDLEVHCEGDLRVDEHHTVEDVALTLGQALDRALGERRGVGRYGFCLPMDETQAQVTMDLGGRPYLVFEGRFSRERVGGLPTELVQHFFDRCVTPRGESAHPGSGFQRPSPDRGGVQGARSHAAPGGRPGRSFRGTSGQHEGVRLRSGSEMNEVVIVSAVRTPIRRLGDSLSSVRPDDLAALVVGEAVRRAGVDPGEVEEVYLGCANQAGEDNRDVARNGASARRIPAPGPWRHVNRLCASGLTAVNLAARAIRAGEGRSTLPEAWRA
jgi:hypothetical protein